MSCPFVQPEIVRLTLSTGDWLDVKRELTAGEYRHYQAAMMKDGVIPSGQSIPLDPEKVGLVRVLEHVVAWSFTDFEGRPVPVSEAALKSMYKAMLVEMIDVVTRHEVAADAQRERDLKNPTGAGGLKAVS